MLYPAELQALGRGRGIRTPDILLPKQTRYQTALYPECFFAYPKALSHLSSRLMILSEH